MIDIAHPWDCTYPELWIDHFIHDPARLQLRTHETLFSFRSLRLHPGSPPELCDPSELFQRLRKQEIPSLEINVSTGPCKPPPAWVTFCFWLQVPFTSSWFPHESQHKFCTFYSSLWSSWWHLRQIHSLSPCHCAQRYVNQSVETLSVNPKPSETLNLALIFFGVYTPIKIFRCIWIFFPYLCIRESIENVKLLQTSWKLWIEGEFSRGFYCECPLEFNYESRGNFSKTFLQSI